MPAATRRSATPRRFLRQLLQCSTLSRAWIARHNAASSCSPFTRHCSTSCAISSPMGTDHVLSGAMAPMRTSRHPALRASRIVASESRSIGMSVTSWIGDGTTASFRTKSTAMSGRQRPPSRVPRLSVTGSCRPARHCHGLRRQIAPSSGQHHDGGRDYADNTTTAPARRRRPGGVSGDRRRTGSPR
jgi:hypothetical protein